MGLGVYDSTETILLERGAWNERRGNDALGQALEPKPEPEPKPRSPNPKPEPESEPEPRARARALIRRDH